MFITPSHSALAVIKLGFLCPELLHDVLVLKISLALTHLYSLIPLSLSHCLAFFHYLYFCYPYFLQLYFHFPIRHSPDIDKITKYVENDHDDFEILCLITSLKYGNVHSLPKTETPFDCLYLLLFMRPQFVLRKAKSFHDTDFFHFLPLFNSFFHRHHHG